MTLTHPSVGFTEAQLSGTHRDAVSTASDAAMSMCNWAETSGSFLKRENDLLHQLLREASGKVLQLGIRRAW